MKNEMFRELLERGIAIVILTVALPLMLLIAMILYCTAGAPVFYQERRLGRREKEFVIFKFRTMVSGIDSSGRSFPRPDACGKEKNDPRITGCGRILRRFSLDELPQLWNVARGEMALVGPRPIIAGEKTIYEKYHVAIHEIKPGLTGLWQVSGRNLTTYRRRVAIDRYYLNHRSLCLDLRILFRTIGAVCGGRGAF